MPHFSSRFLPPLFEDGSSFIFQNRPSDEQRSNEGGRKLESLALKDFAGYSGGIKKACHLRWQAVKINGKNLRLFQAAFHHGHEQVKRVIKLPSDLGIDHDVVLSPSGQRTRTDFEHDLHF